jgi:DNA adenine methylase
MNKPELTPVLKWAGGKRWLVETLRPYYDRNRRFVDPFAGGLALPLALRPDHALLSDANPHLMNLYRWIKHGLEWEEGVGIDWVYDKAVYYENRAKFNALCANRDFWSKEGALLFYYLNRCCYNGLCRFNSEGTFNTPFGKYKTVDLRKTFDIHKEALAGWELYIGDFATLPVQPDDFLYLDPPYDVEFTQFTPKDFTWDDQIRLVNWAAAHQGPVVASNSYTQRIIDLYRSAGFDVRCLPAPRSISCTGDRDPELEILAFKGFTL